MIFQCVCVCVRGGGGGGGVCVRLALNDQFCTCIHREYIFETCGHILTKVRVICILASQWSNCILWSNIRSTENLISPKCQLQPIAFTWRSINKMLWLGTNLESVCIRITNFTNCGLKEPVLIFVDVIALQKYWIKNEVKISHILMSTVVRDFQ